MAIEFNIDFFLKFVKIREEINLIKAGLYEKYYNF